MARGIVVTGGHNITISKNIVAGYDEAIVVTDSINTQIDENSIISPSIAKRVPRETVKAILRSARKGENAQGISDRFGKYLEVYGINLPTAIEKSGGVISMYGPPLVEILKRIFSGNT